MKRIEFKLVGLLCGMCIAACCGQPLLANPPLEPAGPQVAKTLPLLSQESCQLWPAPGVCDPWAIRDDQEEYYSCVDDACVTWCTPKLYAQVDLLFWWVEGNNVPPLVTTSPEGTARDDAGVLGLESTRILHGGGKIDDNYRPGGRVLAGYWFGEPGHNAVEFTWFSLGDGANTGNFYASSLGVPPTRILARPFVNVVSAELDASLVAFPNVLEGDVQVTTNSELHSASISVRHRSWEGCGAVFDFIAGYRYLGYREGLSITEGLTSTDPGGLVPVGTTFDVRDVFATDNDFHGGEFGITGTYFHHAWTLDLVGKIALGNMHQSVRVNGSTTIAEPAAPTVSSPGGLLALPTNMGTRSRDEFVVIPELNMNFAYRWSERLSLSLGYSVLWITDVARTGDQIDLGVNATQLPVNGGLLLGPARPAPRQNDGSMWVQGINLGLAWRY